MHDMITEDAFLLLKKSPAFSLLGDSVLKRLNAKVLVVTGCTTSVCVESTIRDATFRDYSPVLLADCTAEPIGRDLPSSNHEASLVVIQTLFGWVSHSEHFLKALKAPAAAIAG